MPTQSSPQQPGTERGFQSCFHCLGLYLLSAVKIPAVLHLHQESLPTTSTHPSARSFPQALPTPSKPSVPTQLMRVPGSQRQGSSLLSRTLVASSKLMEGTCQDSSLLLGVSLLFTSPCGLILRLYTHTHLFKIQQCSNCTELHSHSRSQKLSEKLKCTPCRKISHK